MTVISELTRSFSSQSCSSNEDDQPTAMHYDSISSDHPERVMMLEVSEEVREAILYDEITNEALWDKNLPSRCRLCDLLDEIEALPERELTQLLDKLEVDCNDCDDCSDNDYHDDEDVSSFETRHWRNCGNDHHRDSILVNKKRLQTNHNHSPPPPPPQDSTAFLRANKSVVVDDVGTKASQQQKLFGSSFHSSFPRTKTSAANNKKRNSMNAIAA